MRGRRRWVQAALESGDASAEATGCGSTANVVRNRWRRASSPTRTSALRRSPDSSACRPAAGTLSSSRSGAGAPGGFASRGLRDGAGSDRDDVEPAVGDDGAHRGVADVQHVLRRRQHGGRFRPERRAEGDGQRIPGEDLILPGVAERRPSPALQGQDDRFELAAERGELVPAADGRNPTDHPGLLQLFEAVAQDVRGDARKPRLEVAVAAGARQEVAHDEQGPPLADALEGARHTAVLAEASSGARAHPGRRVRPCRSARRRSARPCRRRGPSRRPREPCRGTRAGCRPGPPGRAST